MKYNIVYSDDSKDDLIDLFNVITFEYKSPDTAKRYLQGLKNTIHSLSKSAESYSIQTRKSLQQYGPSPRRLNYKRMAIIYNVINDVVYIRRVIPLANIAGL
ncbi:MAG: type II toxin-antitoxin system RelE/ParE family toxin [Paludibacter sp.]